MLIFVLACLHLISAGAQTTSARTIAITIDDLPTASVLGQDVERAERTTTDLLAVIARARVPAIGFVNEGKLRVPAIGFVNEGKLQSGGKVDPRRVALLQRWLDAGLELGNHTYSHPDLHRIELDAFKKDVLRGEIITRRLLAAKGQKPRYFRHPFLHTGRSLAVRDGFHTFLDDHGYIVAPVTLDNYDYVFAAAYDRSLAAGNLAQTARVATEYLDYMEAVAAYYEQQSVAILGREPAQTLLLHANALNAATLDDLVARLRRRGYSFVSLEEALKDPAYASKDEYVGPAGMTWLHRWALTAGKKGIFAGEPAVPEWIQTLSEVR